MYYDDNDIRALKSDMGALENEFKKLNQYWVDKYIEITQKMVVAIGVRNNKIKSLTGVCYTFSNKIEILEKQLEKGWEEWMTIKEQLKVLTEQVDLNAQTLEELR